MRIYVSWASVPAAEAAESTRMEWVTRAKKSKRAEDQSFAELMTAAHCLPEYQAYQLVMQQLNLTRADLPLDSLNRNLLAVRFVAPSLEKVATFQLSRRLPVEGSLPVSLAIRAFLLNSFTGEWSDTAAAPRVTFVGLDGMPQFFESLALACGALGQPLPVRLWRDSPQLVLPKDDVLREFITACADNQTQADDKAKYEALTSGWMGTGASADRDSALLLAAAFKLGYGEIKA